MRFLLDTNVLSEPARPAPNPDVVSWVSAQAGGDLAVSTLVLGEIAGGVERLPPGDRRDRLAAWLEQDLPGRFGRRVLPVDLPVALRWGRMAAEAHDEGRPLPAVDGLMLATASVYGLVFVTRNLRDCGGRGVPVFDPWSGRPA